MATAQFTANQFRNGRAGADYQYWRTGYPSGTNTTNVKYNYHPYKSYFFFNTAAIVAALQGKIVDSISLTLTSSYYTGRQSSAIHAWRMANVTTMPDGATMQAQSTGILTTTGSNSYFVEALATWTLAASGSGTGVIATGAAAIRLADSLEAGNALGLLYRHVNEGETVYSPSVGVQYNGGDVAPVITIEFHDAGSIYANDGGVQKLGMPYANDAGVWKEGAAWVNDGGVWKQGIP